MEAGVKALFIPLDTALLSWLATGQPAIQAVQVFPTPATNGQNIAWETQTPDSINIKAVLVNSKLEPLLRFSFIAAAGVTLLDIAIY